MYRANGKSTSKYYFVYLDSSQYLATEPQTLLDELPTELKDTILEVLPVKTIKTVCIDRSEPCPPNLFYNLAVRYYPSVRASAKRIKQLAPDFDLVSEIRWDRVLEFIEKELPKDTRRLIQQPLEIAQQILRSQDVSIDQRRYLFSSSNLFCSSGCLFCDATCTFFDPITPEAYTLRQEQRARDIQRYAPSLRPFIQPIHAILTAPLYTGRVSFELHSLGLFLLPSGISLWSIVISTDLL